MRQSVAVQRGLNYRVFSTPPSLHVRPPLRAGIVCFVPRRGVLGACQNLVSYCYCTLNDVVSCLHVLLNRRLATERPA